MGSEVSCQLTADAVSALLNDTPIDYCVSMSLDGIATLNDALGGVEVTLEDDFSALDPAMTAGTTLTLRGKQAEYFTRSRMAVGDGTNLSRLARQRVYIRAASAVLRERLAENAGFIRTLFNKLEDYLYMDLSRGAFYNLADKADRYEILPIVEIEGTTTIGAYDYVEFYPDEDALRRVIADTLYERVD